MRAAREGAQVPFAAYPAVKFTPSRAIESMCGVGTDPDATPPPPKVRSFHARRVRTGIPLDLAVGTDRRPQVRRDVDELQQEGVAVEPSHAGHHDQHGQDPRAPSQHGCPP
jgi:hypothetical protein